MKEEQNPTNSALSASMLEAVKLIPGTSILIEGIKNYKNTIEENQRKRFLELLEERVNTLEKLVKSEWYSTDDGKEFVEKLVATALNAEYTDKMVFFRNMLFNGAIYEFDQIEKLKFIEMAAHLSKAALSVLAAANQIHIERGPRYSRQIDGPSDINRIIEITHFDEDLVLSCVNELYSEGAFNSKEFSPGISAFREITERFVEFLSDPEN